MKGVAVFCMALVLLIIPTTVYADSHQRSEQIDWDTLSDLSDDIYQLIDYEQYDLAKKKIETFYNKWNLFTALNPELRPKKIRVVNASIEKLQQTLAKPEFETEIRREAAIEFRLVVNALTGDRSPMWLMFEKELMDHLDTLAQALSKQDYTLYQRELNHFIDLYYMLYPALLIDLNENKISSVDAAVKHLIENRKTADEAMIENITTLSQHLSQLFKTFPTKLDARSSMGWTVVSIGGLIICTLFYVSWKKYRAQNYGGFNYPRL